MKPSEIPLGYYTHLNFAFALIDPITFQVSSMGPEVAANYDALTSLKGSQPNLKVWLSIGMCSTSVHSPSRILMHFFRWLVNERSRSNSNNLLRSCSIFGGSDQVFQLINHFHGSSRL